MLQLKELVVYESKYVLELCMPWYERFEKVVVNIFRCYTKSKRV